MTDIVIGTQFVNKDGDGLEYRVVAPCGDGWWNCETVEKYPRQTLFSRGKIEMHIPRLLCEAEIKRGMAYITRCAGGNYLE